MAFVEDPTGQNPPGPVGIGPGFWKYDAWGGGWRDDWQEDRPWDLMGENEGDQRINEQRGTLGPTGMPNPQRVRQSQQASPHFNPILGAAWAAHHPGGNTPPGEGVKTGDYNPDIFKLLAGLGGGGGDQPAGGPMPPGAGGPTSKPPLFGPPAGGGMHGGSAQFLGPPAGAGQAQPGPGGVMDQQPFEPLEQLYAALAQKRRHKGAYLGPPSVTPKAGAPA